MGPPPADASLAASSPAAPTLHRTLERQVRKWLGGAPIDAPGWASFLQAVSDYFNQNDEHRMLTERSLELTSQELLDINSRVNAHAKRLEQEIAERQRAEEKLVLAARAAGMAEVATSVLHNVGNVLNTVNVSATLLQERLQTSRLAGLPRVAELLRSHQDDLADFLTRDPKGPVLLEFVEQLAQYWHQERTELFGELDTLTSNLQHIKDIVSRQQSLGQVCDVLEQVALDHLVEDAIKISTRPQQPVEIERDVETLPPVLLDRVRTLQILVNLLNNALDAVKGLPDASILVRTREDGPRVLVQVVDNGLGIRPDDLDRIFSFGFTTKPQGHGFGLHTSALAAQELGGALKATSPGLGQGSCFTLRLPRHPAGREVL